MDIASVTVIVPVFNGSASGLVTCLESVFQQTYMKMNVIIIDDYSSDNSIELINQLIRRFHKECTVITHKANHGLSKSLNEGIELSSGSYVLILQQDCSLKTKTTLEESIEFMTANNYKVLVGSSSIDWGTLNIYQKLFKIRISEQFTSSVLSDRIYVSQLKCDIFKREVFEIVGKFDFTNKTVGQDFIMSSKLYEKSISMFTYNNFVYNIQYKGEDMLSSLCKKEFRYAFAVPYVLKNWYDSGFLKNNDTNQSKVKKYSRFFNLFFPMILVLLLVASSFMGFPITITLIAILISFWILRILTIIMAPLRNYSSLPEFIISVFVFILLDIIYLIGVLFGIPTLLKLVHPLN
jgi:glycosyltransferase involved in cell wall biosynthesis